MTVGAFAIGSLVARGAIWFLEGAGVGLEGLLAKEAAHAVVNGAIVPLLSPRNGELTPEGYESFSFTMIEYA